MSKTWCWVIYANVSEIIKISVGCTDFAEILSETQFEPGAHFLDFCFTTQFATRRAHSC